MKANLQCTLCMLHYSKKYKNQKYMDYSLSLPPASGKVILALGPKPSEVKALF